MRYEPKPIDMNGIELPADLVELTEKLAEHTHDLWSLNRLSQGWTYGPKRDDDLKTNPCLVPYSDLPDKEKDYDRNTALGTLRAIIALGYSIQKPA